MERLKISIIGFFIAVFLMVADAYGGPVVCDGDVGNGTTKATGQLLVALGFAYSAMGFVEAGEPEKITPLQRLTTPVANAKEAAKLFNDFVKAKLPSKLRRLDTIVLKTNYQILYEEFIGKGIVVPQQVWAEVSNKALAEGLKGLMVI